jgi:hypothetical protein
MSLDKRQRDGAILVTLRLNERMVTDGLTKAQLLARHDQDKLGTSRGLPWHRCVSADMPCRSAAPATDWLVQHLISEPH